MEGEQIELNTMCVESGAETKNENTSADRLSRTSLHRQPRENMHMSPLVQTTRKQLLMIQTRET